MSPSEFEEQCKALCSYCKDGSIPRFRSDSKEYVHDTAVTIPGTLGKRMGHAFCTASDFRKENEGKLSG